MLTKLTKGGGRVGEKLTMADKGEGGSWPPILGWRNLWTAPYMTVSNTIHYTTVQHCTLQTCSALYLTGRFIPLYLTGLFLALYRTGLFLILYITQLFSTVPYRTVSNTVPYTTIQHCTLQTCRALYLSGLFGTVPYRPVQHCTLQTCWALYLPGLSCGDWKQEW